MTTLSDNCCEDCNRVRITCTGQLYMCIGQDDRADLRTPLRKDSSNISVLSAIDEAIGRKPNVKASKPQNAGVEIGQDGFIKVFSNRKTSANNIYAIGDITGQPMLAHKASHEGRVAAEVIKGEKGSAYDAKVIPAIVFTDPEIAWCGLTEEELKSSNIDAKVVKFPWSASGRAKALGTDNGLTKLIVDKESEIILGGGVAGKNAGSLIPEIA